MYRQFRCCDGKRFWPYPFDLVFTRYMRFHLPALDNDDLQIGSTIQVVRFHIDNVKLAALRTNQTLFWNTEAQIVSYRCSFRSSLSYFCLRHNYYSLVQHESRFKLPSSGEKTDYLSGRTSRWFIDFTNCNEGKTTMSLCQPHRLKEQNNTMWMRFVIVSSSASRRRWGSTLGIPFRWRNGHTRALF